MQKQVVVQKCMSSKPDLASLKTEVDNLDIE